MDKKFQTAIHYRFIFFLRVFTVKPTKGLLSPSQHQIFVMKILPKHVKNYKHLLKLKLNASDKHTQVIYYFIIKLIVLNECSNKYYVEPFNSVSWLSPFDACRDVFFRHLKLKLLTQFPASNVKKIFILMKHRRKYFFFNYISI